MPVLFGFLLFFAACILLSIGLTPWLHPLLPEGAIAPDKLLYRLAMLLGLLGMPWLLSSLDLRGRPNMGLSKPAEGSWNVIAQGILLGTGILGGLALLLMLSGTRVWADDAEFSAMILKTLLSGIISGLLVGIIEEFFFRGPLQTGMRRHLGFWPVALLISAFYSAVHFIRPAHWLDGDFDTFAAIDVTLAGFAQLGDFNAIADNFVGLLLAGLFLSMVRERTGSIYMAIGVHAGWVMVIKLFKDLTDVDKTSEAAFWVGSHDYITGWMSSIWIGALAVVYWWWTSPNRKKGA